MNCLPTYMECRKGMEEISHSQAAKHLERLAKLLPVVAQAGVTLLWLRHFHALPARVSASSPKNSLIVLPDKLWRGIVTAAKGILPEQRFNGKKITAADLEDPTHWARSVELVYSGSSASPLTVMISRVNLTPLGKKANVVMSKMARVYGGQPLPPYMLIEQPLSCDELCLAAG